MLDQSTTATRSPAQGSPSLAILLAPTILLLLGGLLLITVVWRGAFGSAWQKTLACAYICVPNLFGGGVLVFGSSRLQAAAAGFMAGFWLPVGAYIIFLGLFALLGFPVFVLPWCASVCLASWTIVAALFYHRLDPTRFLVSSGLGAIFAILPPIALKWILLR